MCFLPILLNLMKNHKKNSIWITLNDGVIISIVRHSCCDKLRAKEQILRVHTWTDTCLFSKHLQEYGWWSHNRNQSLLLFEKVTESSKEIRLELRLSENTVYVSENEAKDYVQNYGA